MYTSRASSLGDILSSLLLSSLVARCVFVLLRLESMVSDSSFFHPSSTPSDDANARICGVTARRTTTKTRRVRKKNDDESIFPLLRFRPREGADLVMVLSLSEYTFGRCRRCCCEM